MDRTIGYATPMYTAVLICALGLWLMHVTWLSTIGYLVLAAVLWIKAGREEEILIGAFEQYAQYQRRTYRFIPFVY
ncbi:MAG: hypothetical protein K0U93_09055 [Gammaproteobacteria bacterium]|nr:hypothetical protein [Gammaproteobacteria bacterium]